MLAFLKKNQLSEMDASSPQDLQAMALKSFKRTFDMFQTDAYMRPIEEHRYVTLQTVFPLFLRFVLLTFPP